MSSAALYHHVSSMQDLYGLMTEYVLRRAIPVHKDGQSWQDWFRGNAMKHREAFMAHRDSGKVASLSIPSTKMYSDLLPTLISPLVAAGVAAHDALAANGALGSLLLGSILYEQHEEHRKRLAGLLPVAEAFRYGVDAIIAGTLEKTKSKKNGEDRIQVKSQRKVK